MAISDNVPAYLSELSDYLGWFLSDFQKNSKHWACWPLNRLYQYHARCHASKKIKNRLNVPCSNNFWQIENFRKYVSRIKKIEHLSKWQMLKYIRKHMIFDQNYFSKLILESFNLLFQLIKVHIFRSSNFWIASRAPKNGHQSHLVYFQKRSLKIKILSIKKKIQSKFSKSSKIF